MTGTYLMHVVTPEMVAPGAPLGVAPLALAVLAEVLLHLIELPRLLVRVDHLEVTLRSFHFIRPTGCTFVNTRVREYDVLERIRSYLRVYICSRYSTEIRCIPFVSGRICVYLQPRSRYSKIRSEYTFTQRIWSTPVRYGLDTVRYVVSQDTKEYAKIHTDT